MTYKILLIQFLFIALLSQNTYASVIGEPQCHVDIKITSLDKENNKKAIGKTIKSKSSGWLPNSLCEEFSNKKITIRNHGQLYEGQEFTLGVQQMSAMGSEGPVYFFHWDTLSNITPENIQYPEVQIVK